MLLRSLTLFLCLFIVSACDSDNEGGGSYEIATPEIFPAVQAGEDREEDEQQIISLQGQVDTGSAAISSTVWSQTAGEVVTISDKNTLTPTVSLPATTSKTTLTFALTVTDASGNQVSDNLTIHVNPINTSPTAQAGNDFAALEQTLVTLDGSGNDSDGNIVSYSWDQVSGPPVVLSDNNSLQPSFTAPAITNEVTVEFTFSVTDNEGAVSTDHLAVKIDPATEVSITFPGNGLYSGTAIDIAGRIDNYSGDYTTLNLTVSSGINVIRIPVDNIGRWRATDFPLANITDIATITVNVDDGAGFTDTKTVTLDLRVSLDWPTDVVVNNNTEKVYISDATLQSIIELDLNTGIRKIISGNGIGAGPALTNPVDLQLDNNRLLVLNSGGDNSLLEVDLTTGNRTRLSGLDIGTGPTLLAPKRMSIDSTNNRMFVSDHILSGIISINMSNGNRTLIVDSNWNAGAGFSQVHALTYEATGNRLFIGDDTNQAVYEYSLDNDHVSLISGSTVSSTKGIGEPLWRPEDFSVNVTENLLYVSSTQKSDVLAINLNNGNRTTVGSHANIDGIEFDNTNNLLYTVNDLYGELNTYDIKQGETVTLFNSRVGTMMEELGFIYDISFDESQETLYVNSAFNQNFENLMFTAINPVSGKNEKIGRSPATGYTVMDSTKQRILITKSSNGGSLLEFDLESRQSRDLLSAAINPDQSFVNMTGFCLFKNANLAFVSLKNEIIKIDLNSNTTSIIANSTTGSGDNLDNIKSITCDENSNTVIALDKTARSGGFSTIYSVNADNGDRTSRYLFASNNQTVNPDDLDYDSKNDLIFMTAQGNDRSIQKLDSLNQLSTVSSSAVGRGPLLGYSPQLTIDEKNQRAFFTHSYNKLFLMDITSGDRVIIHW